MLKALLISSLLLSPFTLADEVENAWHELAIVSQNAGYRIHMMGVDTELPKAEDFAPQIASINKNLDLLVDKGILQKTQFELRPDIDLQESVVKAVEKIVRKHEAKYGIYVIREMMDIGARQYTIEYEENAPLVLNVRMPKDFLDELKVVLEKEGFQK
jgi:hypothetical protein